MDLSGIFSILTLLNLGVFALIAFGIGVLKDSRSRALIPDRGKCPSPYIGSNPLPLFVTLISG